MTFPKTYAFMDLGEEDPKYNKPLDPLGKSIDILNIILHKCPQHRYVDLRYAFWARNIGAVLYVSLILFGLAKMWFSHYIPTPFVLISTAIFFILGGCFELLLLHVYNKQKHDMVEWKKEVIAVAIMICSLGHERNRLAKLSLASILSERKKELDVAFKECDKPTEGVYQRLMNISQS